MQEGERVVVAIFPVLGEAAASVEPCDGSLNDPSLWFNDKAFGAIGSFNDFHHQIVYRIDGTALKHRSSIRAVGEQFAQERELPKQSGYQQDTAVAVLNVSSGHQCMQQQAQCIDQDVTFLALDQLAGIEAVRVDTRAPFSALLTLWLSMTQAVGLASRSACSRHFT